MAGRFSVNEVVCVYVNTQACCMSFSPQINMWHIGIEGLLHALCLLLGLGSLRYEDSEALVQMQCIYVFDTL